MVVLTSALFACSKKAPVSNVKPAAAAPAATVAVAKTVTPDQEGSPDGKLDPNDPKHGTRKLLNLDAPVYVDGVQRGVFRYGDLPAIKATMLTGNTPVFQLYDYLKAIGVSPERVKAVHLHDNANRIGSFEGSELVKLKSQIKFGFQSGITGTAVAKWDLGGIKNEYSPHEIRTVSVYVDKPVPVLKRPAMCHVDADGECMGEKIPYASAPAKGTRVYLDGNWSGFVKRRLVSNDMMVGSDTPEGDHKLSLAKLVESFKASAANAKAIELVAGDDVIARFTPEQWKALGSSLYFVLPKHGHGKIRVHVPAEVQATEEGAPATDRDALVSAVIVYRNTSPSGRDLTPISEDTDLSVQLAQGETTAREGRGEN